MWDLIHRLTRSSDGSGNLSMTVKGFLVALVPVAITLGSLAGVDVDAGSLNGFIDALVNAIEAVSAAVAAVLVVIGFLRKAYRWAKAFFESRGI